jgi:DNA-binding transcriptional ArsR family regulator
MNPTTRVPGRLLAWAALLVALGASVAANVGAARPELGPRLSSAVAPVLALFAAGLLERVPLGTARRWQRWLAWLGLGTVGAAAFITSFDHQRALLLEYGNTVTAAVLLPVAVDGLILMSTVSLTVIGERRRQLAADALPSIPVGETVVGREGDAVVVDVTDADYTLSPRVSDTATDSGSADEQPKQQVRRGVRKQSTAERVVAAKRRTPDASAGDIARRLGVTERTVQRHLSTLTVSVPEGPAGETRGERIWREGNAALDAAEVITGERRGSVSWTDPAVSSPPPNGSPARPLVDA